MILGTDLSKWNTQLNYDEMAKEIKFAFIRATQGNYIQDALYTKHKENLDRLEIPWGPYHLYDLSQKVDSQLNNFFTKVGPDQFDLQPVLDIELFSWWTKPTRDNALAVIKVFLEGVKAHWNKKPLIYTNPKFINEVLNYQVPEWLLEYELWIAHWRVSTPQTKPWTSYKYWQFNGDVAGVSYSPGNGFDFNYFNGTYADLLGTAPVLTLEQRVDRIEKILNIS